MHDRQALSSCNVLKVLSQILWQLPLRAMRAAFAYESDESGLRPCMACTTCTFLQGLWYLQLAMPCNVVAAIAAAATVHRPQEKA